MSSADDLNRFFPIVPQNAPPDDLSSYLDMYAHEAGAYYRSQTSGAPPNGYEKFVNPPFPFPLENNLAVVDFVQLQHDAAQYVESNFPGRRVATVWPFSAALQNPDLGYVQNGITTLLAPGRHLADFQSLGLRDSDVIVLFSKGELPPDFVLQNPTLRSWFAPFVDLQPEATSLELKTLGYESTARWARYGQWITIYSRVPPP